MDATFEPGAGYRPLGFTEAFLAQFRLLWSSRRPLLLGIGLLALLGLAGEPWSEDLMARLFTLWPLWIFIIGPLWAFVIWHNEGPSNRLYFWSHPVSRAGHSMARLAAGAAWLWLLYALLIAAGLLFAVFDGDVGQFAMIQPAAWVSFFTGPLIGYLVISVLTVPSDYPIRWFLAIAFLVPITLSLLIQSFGLGDFVDWLFTPLTNTEWGLGVAMVAPFGDAIMGLQRALHGSGGLSRPITNPQAWWIAMPLWILFWTGLVLLLARRHPDVFPRLRRPASRV